MYFCSERGSNPFSPPVTCLLDFLAALYRKGLSYSSINSARSAVSSFCAMTFANEPIGKHCLVKRFMRGVFLLRPSLPRYQVTWPVDKVLHFLERLTVDPGCVDLKQLTLKTVMLLALLSGQRLQSLHLITLQNVTISDSLIKIRFGDLIKQSRPNYHLHELTFHTFANVQLCIVFHLTLYREVTQPLRGNESALFISFCRPHKKVSKDTIARWIRTVMQDSGIDISIFKPHSCRAASVSHANKVGVPLATILRTAGWSSDCTFRKFYNKPITNDTSFAEAVLSDFQQH